MSRLAKAFNKQQSRYGGYAALLTTIIIIIVIVINLLVGEIDLTYDASINRVFSISQESEEVAKAVDTPVVIYGLFEIGQESRGYDLIVSNYTNLSKQITASHIDPIKNPAFSMQYAKEGEGEALLPGSYIVVAKASGRYKIIGSKDIIDNAYDTSSGEQVNAIVLEQQLTSAIKYVTTDKLPKVYQLTGHGEETLAESALRELELDNYLLSDLVIMDKGIVPEDCDVLVINGPTSDISEAELQILNAYFDDFGSAMFFVGLVSEAMPNFARLFENYGVEVYRDSIVFESDLSNYYQSPVLLIPNMEEHAIMEPLIKENLRLTAMTSQYIKEVGVVRDEITIEPLLTTSKGAYAKDHVTDTSIIEKEEGDTEGPFVIASAITDHKEWDESEGDYNSAKIIVVANSVMLKSQAYAAEPNYDFFIYCTNWLAGSVDASAMYIKPKNVDVMPLQMNAMQIYIYSGLSVVVVPSLILITGFVVWRKRRHL